MPRAKQPTTQTLDEQLMALPPYARPTAAAARNSAIRTREHREAMLTESKKLRAHVRKLHVHHEVSVYRIALLLDISDTRVRAILAKTGRRT
jgi:hypothetical protein